MTLSDWLDKQPGRAAAMAKHFKISTAAVSAWKKSGVPLAKMRAVRTYTRRAVSFEDMVPGK